MVFQDAMRLLFEGRFGQALKKAGEAHAANHAPALAALLAARAARYPGEAEKGKAWHGLSAPARTIRGWNGHD